MDYNFLWQSLAVADMVVFSGVTKIVDFLQSSAATYTPAGGVVFPTVAAAVRTIFYNVRMSKVDNVHILSRDRSVFVLAKDLVPYYTPVPDDTLSDMDGVSYTIKDVRPIGDRVGWILRVRP